MSDDAAAQVPEAAPCRCAARPAWARVDDDSVGEMPVLESGDWEEMRRCSVCGRYWLGVWPEEMQGGMFLCRPEPPEARRLRDIDHAATLRGYFVAQIEEALGDLKEAKVPCKKVGCTRNRLRAGSYCLEHAIAQRFGKRMARLEAPK